MASKSLPLGFQCSQHSSSRVSAQQDNIRKVHLNNDTVQLIKDPMQPTPIAQLPPEILAEIFHIYSTDCFERQRHAASRRSRCVEAVEWTRVCHVCHHWRIVALSFPRLWSNITGYNTNYLETSLIRSAGTVLNFQLHNGSTDDLDGHLLTDILEILFKHTSRVGSLDLHISTFPRNFLRPWSEVHAAPMLKSLTLNYDVQMTDIRTLWLGDLLPQMCMPSLTHLEISDDKYDWVGGDYPESLINLKIEYSAPYAARWGKQSHSVLEIHHILNKLHLLQHFSLIHALPSVHIEDTNMDRLCLPALRTLHLEGFASNILKLYTHMVVPHDTTITLSLEYESREGWVEQYLELTQCIPSLLAGEVDTDDGTVRVVFTSRSTWDDFHFSLRAWRASPNTAPSQGTTPWSGLQSAIAKSDITVRVHVISDRFENDPDYDLYTFLYELACELPFDKLEVIDIARLETPYSLLHTVARHSPRLIHITLTSTSGLRAFLDTTLTVGEREIFPALSSLEIFHESKYHSIDDDDGRDNLYELLELLTSWANNGRRLKSVVIFRAMLGQDHTQSISTTLATLVDSFEFHQA
ncbi:hypothetical protein ABKN59_008773 [Abortiporus biennis]